MSEGTEQNKTNTDVKDREPNKKDVLKKEGGGELRLLFHFKKDKFIYIVEWSLMSCSTASRADKAAPWTVAES